MWYRISGVFSGCEVNTTQRYDNDAWHYLTALYSRGVCSITVDDEVVTQSTSDLIIPTQDGDDYIGGAPMFAGRYVTAMAVVCTLLVSYMHFRGVPFVSFAGCLRDVIIGTVSRNLSDNIGSERINFNGCPLNVSAIQKSLTGFNL